MLPAVVNPTPVLVQFAVRRFVGREAGRRPPASFVLVPIGLGSGVIGAILRILSAEEIVPSWLGGLGRTLALEGVFTCLVLGIGGFFFALALRGDPPPDLGKNKGDLRRALLFRPDLAGALYNLAEILFAKGAYKDAEVYLSRYMRLGEPTLSALVLGVKLARAQGDKASEDSMLQQLRRRFPEAPQARELLEAKR